MLGYIQKIRIKNKKLTYNLKDAVLRLLGPSVVVVVVAVFVILDPVCVKKSLIIIRKNKIKKKNIPMGHPNPGVVVDGGGEVVVTWQGGGVDVARWW